MKLTVVIISAILAVFIAGCVQTSTVSGTQNLVLNEQDLAQLGINGGPDCYTETYQTGSYSPLMQYSFCNFTISSLNNTEVVLELKKFTNFNDLNGTYQYESLHLRSSEGLIGENDYGDQSRFYVNNENDYGGEFNEPDVYYYALYFTKGEYLIHVTSGGRSTQAQSYIAQIGQRILSKFE